jgi:hypothetical protein
MSDRHKRQPISFRPSPELWAWLDEQAAAEGKPVRQIIKESLELERDLDRAAGGRAHLRRTATALRELAASEGQQ